MAHSFERSSTTPKGCFVSKSACSKTTEARHKQQRQRQQQQHRRGFGPRKEEVAGVGGRERSEREKN